MQPSGCFFLGNQLSFAKEFTQNLAHNVPLKPLHLVAIGQNK
jgi:hypothetical protein